MRKLLLRTMSSDAERRRAKLLARGADRLNALSQAAAASSSSTTTSSNVTTTDPILQTVKSNETTSAKSIADLSSSTHTDPVETASESTPTTTTSDENALPTNPQTGLRHRRGGKGVSAEDALLEEQLNLLQLRLSGNTKPVQQPTTSQSTTSQHHTQAAAARRDFAAMGGEAVGESLRAPTQLPRETATTDWRPLAKVVLVAVCAVGLAIAPSNLGVSQHALGMWILLELVLRGVFGVPAASTQSASPLAGVQGMKIFDLTSNIAAAYRGVFAVTRRLCVFVCFYAMAFQCAQLCWE
jgi:hypothetical protein